MGLCEKDAISPARCPEPLRCDIQTLQDFQSSLQGVALLGLVAIIVNPFIPTGTSVDETSSLFHTVVKEIKRPKPALDQICTIVQDSITDLRHVKGVPPVEFQKLDAALD